MKLIGYVTSGFPSIEQSIEMAEQYIRGGCDMLEISLPLVENKEADYLSDVMVKAYTSCPDYGRHLEAIAALVHKYPAVPITLLLYNAVALRIGAEKLGEFCRVNRIQDINSADLSDQHVMEALHANGVRIAGLVRACFDDESIIQAKKTDGFIYMTAFAPAEKCRPGFEALTERIAHVRAAGIHNPIYCGGGVRTPQDAVTVREAGADGVFLGTSILQLHDRPETLVQTVRAFRDAIDSAGGGTE